jgi:hypothetical protein
VGETVEFAPVNERNDHLSPIDTIACKFRLWQDDDFSHHSQPIVQHTLILVNAGLGEGHAEAGYAQRSLWQTNTILRRLTNPNFSTKK